MLNISTIMIIALAILGSIILVMAGFIIYLYRKLNRFLSDSKAIGLDTSIVNINGSIHELETFRTELEKYLLGVENRLKRSVQSVHTVRFNPFKGTGSGGNQSFATAFLNEDGDGVVISSLYSRDHVSIFSKPVKAGASTYELSEEEIAATKEAERLLRNFSIIEKK
jgi:hypothetical protein